MPFEETRIKLVSFFDRLFNILKSYPDYQSFLLDGQSIILEDYLELRPEKHDLLKQYVSNRRIFVGPWYVLPDEFLESGESIIRNLSLGHKIASTFGRVMKIGYVPDPFGHILQLPQILRGFSIDSMIFSRGLGEEGEKLGSEFIWKAPDGSNVLAIHQVLGYWDSRALGYDEPDESGNSTKPLNLNKALKTINDNKSILTKYARTEYLLSNNGEDFHEPQPEIPQIIKYLNRYLQDSIVVHSNLEDYVEKIRSSKLKLGHFFGEMRNIKYQFLLSGVLSSRIYLKQANERDQTYLEKIAEPLGTISWMEGLEYQENLFWLAWKRLIQSHPHDSICGCGVDEVHQDVMRRLAWVKQISEGISESALQHIVSRIDTITEDSSFQPLIVLNTLNWQRDEIIKTRIFPNIKTVSNTNYIIYDPQGTKIYPHTIKINRRDKKDEIEVSFMARCIPPYGYKVFYITTTNETDRSSTQIKTSPNSIENDLIKVTANRNGTLRITDKVSNQTLDNLLVFEDQEDAGDEYSYSPSKISMRITTENCKAKIKVEKSQFHATLNIDLKLSLPKELSKDRSIRSGKKMTCIIRNRVIIYSGIKRIDIDTKIENKTKDHRLRVIFPTDIKTNHTYAESQFTIVKRKVAVGSAKNWKEPPSSTHPQQSFVTISDRNKSLTLINQGLPEYDSKTSIEGVTISLTLMRCVGWLSRDDLSTRKGKAGPQIPTPDAQCLGTFEFKYSILLNDKNWTKRKVWKDAYNRNVPLIAKTTKQHTGQFPKEFSFIQIEPETVIVSALKKADNKEQLVIRVFTFESKEIPIKITFSKIIKKVSHLNLNEEPIEVETPIVTNKNILLFHIMPNKIMTIGVEF